MCTNACVRVRPGQVEIKMSQLLDQISHEGWMQLVDTHGKSMQGNIKLRVQWVYTLEVLDLSKVNEFVLPFLVRL
jgi:hypothetical protein